MSSFAYTASNVKQKPLYLFLSTSPAAEITEYRGLAAEFRNSSKGYLSVVDPGATEDPMEGAIIVEYSGDATGGETTVDFSTFTSCQWFINSMNTGNVLTISIGGSEKSLNPGGYGMVYYNTKDEEVVIYNFDNAEFIYPVGLIDTDSFSWSIDPGEKKKALGGENFTISYNFNLSATVLALGQKLASIGVVSATDDLIEQGGTYDLHVLRDGPGCLSVLSVPLDVSKTAIGKQIPSYTISATIEGIEDNQYSIWDDV